MILDVFTSQKTSGTKDVKGRQIPIACGAWFTSTGSLKPICFKIKDANEEIITVSNIRITHTEDKMYSGIPTTEFTCKIPIHDGTEIIDCKVIYFPDRKEWVLVL